MGYLLSVGWVVMLLCLSMPGQGVAAEVVENTLLREPEKLFSITRGARLYDNWYHELELRTPKKRHVSYPESAAFAHKAKEHWRCKECHGWDGLGKDGQYGQGRHQTGIKGIQQMRGANSAAVVAILTDAKHGYGERMPPEALQDLAAFISGGQVEMARYLEPQSGKCKMGDVVKGKSYYLTLCSQCHGTEGISRGMPIVGKAAIKEPWLVLHKTLHGHPGSGMVGLRALGMDITMDLMSYMQTLPTQR
uniref:Cytochrome c domain-containing protein n=1 Tax=Magnetococcus massalia (strain MO-1) TaxID=451514 RepID=A0A1S7LH45_MAGMO|nr:protein of unknown function [Candidatus Magnetococcus massalia]